LQNYSQLFISSLIIFICRLLGSAAQILAERKNVHHCLLHGLESHDNVEVEAAVWATAAFAAQSRQGCLNHYFFHPNIKLCGRSFATSALDQLARMVEDLSTPIDLKLKLLTILQHMHYNASMTNKVHLISL
jgi:integrator complex subunit 7